MSDMSDVKPAPPFPIEAIAAVPAPGMAVANSFSFSQDDASVAYLLGSAEQPAQQLYALNTASGAANVLATPPGGGVNEENLSPEEVLRRQRERNLATGITHYNRAQHSDRMLIPLRGDIYMLDAPGAPLRQLLDNAGNPPALNATLSPDGAQVAYVQDAEVYVVPATGGAPRQITFGARGTGKTNGLAEYIAQEELDRAEGFWWSPDGASIAYAEVDETHIPLYRIPHLGVDSTGPEAVEEHRYPFAGQPNARVRLAVVSAQDEDREPVWMDLDSGEEGYLARVFWWRDGTLGAVLLNRPQTALHLVRFDPRTGQRTTVLSEQTDTWLNLPRQPLLQLESGDFVWTSERTGYRHLYRYDARGTLLRQLTGGEWMVDALKSLDEARHLVYFTGNRGDPRQAQLYAVALDGPNGGEDGGEDGGEPRQITREPGTHDVTLDHAGTRFVDVYSSIETPPTVTLRSLADGAVLHPIPAFPDPRVAAYHLQPPQLVTLTNREGTPLYGALYRPPSRFGPGPYPTIIHVYGGPHAQMVTNSWGRMTAAMDIQYLRSLGFLVFRLDNRGSARRGLAFERPLRHHMGSAEVHDQVDGVRWLVDQGLADPARVGVMGWSYGGYMSLMCLAQAPETFKVAVAGAPVTAWDGYDTAYTERYMGTPQSNPEGYVESAVTRHAGNIRGKLLLVHGMIDENVHFRHTARLMNTLIRARIPYDTLFFPDERHMPRHAADRVYQYERIVGYFERHL